MAYDAQQVCIDKTLERATGPVCAMVGQAVRALLHKFGQVRQQGLHHFLEVLLGCFTGDVHNLAEAAQPRAGVHLTISAEGRGRLQGRLLGVDRLIFFFLLF